MAGIISSISNQGSLAGGQGANQTIVQLTGAVLTQPGVYRVRAYVTYGSGPGAADASNVKLVCGTSSEVLPMAAVAGPYGPYEFKVMVDGSTLISLQTATAGPSVAAYTGMLVAEYLGRNGQLAKYV